MIKDCKATNHDNKFTMKLLAKQTHCMKLVFSKIRPFWRFSLKNIGLLEEENMTLNDENNE